MKEIKNVAVIGAGAMGMQIALNAAVAGFTVNLTDTFPTTLEKAQGWAKKYLGKSVELGKIAQADFDTVFTRIAFEPDLAATVKNADLIIEAIIEKADEKTNLFTQLNTMAPADAIITSNSSFLPSSQFANCITNPTRMANLHYFNPAMRMELVEIVKGEHTNIETVESLKAFVTAIGKTYIIVNKEIEGFIVNRLLRAVQNEAFFLLKNGIATFEDIDLAAEKGLNYPMGPFRLQDFTGLDIGYYNRMETFEATNDPADAPPKEMVERFERGEFGRKAGKGWYDYSK